MKPRCQLTGTDGNVFSLVAKASSALKKSGQADKAKELQSKIWQCSSYDDALRLITEYVDAE